MKTSGRAKLTWILAVLVGLTATVGVCQEVVIEQAESDFLESVQGADGLSLDGYAGPLIATVGNETNAVADANGPEDLMMLIAGRVLSLETTPTPTGPVLAITADAQGVIITWPAEGNGFMLETTSQLGNPASWQPISPAPPGNSYRPPREGVARFYRLRSP